MTKGYLIPKIIEFRDKGATQQETAAALNIAQTTVSRICRRHRIIWGDHNRRCNNQAGENNHNFKGGIGRSTVERATRVAIKNSGRDLTKCERCGYIDFTRQELPRHHKDRNRLNNSSDNLEVLCWSCHNKEHTHENGRSQSGRFLPKI